MDRNEAIARIAETAIEGIYKISNDAIHLLGGVSLGEAVVGVVSQPESTLTLASTGEKRPRGRPRKTDASTSVSAPIIEPQSDNEIDYEAEIKVGGDTPAECDEMDAYHSDKFDVEERAFPMFEDGWFAANLEEARKYCRELLSARISEIGTDATRKEIVDTTGRVKVSDFDGEACMKFYRAVTRAIVNA